MDKAFHGPVAPVPTTPSRFTVGRGVRHGLAACLSVWISVGTLTTVSCAAAEEIASQPYQQALGSFQRRNYRRALTLLERLPDGLAASQKADALNLRGAIYLRQGRFGQARTAFAEAAQTDPKLWAARYNEAEVSFREKRYTESRREFDALRGHTSRVFHPQENRFLDYKARLADVCAGRPEAAREFIDRHRNDPAPPPAWYYLNAALERQAGRPQKAAQWLAQAEDKVAGANTQLYAESLERLDRSDDSATAGTHLVSVAASRRAARRSSGAETAVVKRSHEETTAAPTTTVAVVQLLPDAAVPVAPDSKDFNPEEPPAFRLDASAASDEQVASAGAPPAAPGLLSGESNPAATAGADGPVASVLAKPRRGRATPTPSPTASTSPTPTPDETPSTQPGTAATPDASPAASASSPSPAPSAASSPSPAASTAAATPEYTEKYEAAYVKFKEKDYSATLDLLDEADKIQSKQPETTTLRAQVFKQAYEAAYLAYRKTDYPAALSFLDLADRAQPNYPDALNLRGLVYAKQRLYDRAEALFNRAIAADPTLWAAKFNFAELPFNRGDYTTARGRFEDLLAETDASKRPREAELTQYKVFLTLLLEGKTDQARSFMDHFNFSGATPAKYFCNAAMNFRAGTTDKAIGWIDSAKKEYPPQLVSIFLESFYRLGWMADPSAAGPGAALAAASPAVEAAAPSVAPVPSATPGASVAASATPVPSVAVAAASATPAATASASPVLMAASSPSATVALGATASPAPSPLASVSPTVAASTPAPTSTPLPSAMPAVTPTAAPSETPAPNEEAGEEDSAGNDILRLGIIAAVLLYGGWISYRLISTAARRKAQRRAARAARTAAAEHSDTLR